MVIKDYNPYIFNQLKPIKMTLDSKGLKGLLYLGKHLENNKQIVYASTLYGTFFTVYGTFTVEENPTSKKLIIKTADFELKNYKGILNIALTGVNYNSNLQQIELQLEALGKNTARPLKNIKIDPSKELQFIRKLSPINSKKHPEIHDDEFDFRDGDFTMKRPPYDLINENNKGDIEKCIASNVPYELDSIDKAPGGRCMMSELKVIM